MEDVQLAAVLKNLYLFPTSTDVGLMSAFMDLTPSHRCHDLSECNTFSLTDHLIVTPSPTSPHQPTPP